GRTVKKIFGKTTNELLNEYRLEKSAADLCITNKAVLEIAMDSGFDNLGYFYRLFKRHFNESPCRFRKLHQALIFTFTSGGKNGNCK
ncbi:MAG TPA: helix-turn-helix transcriptional regulator, partial [Phycisphaerae bacterium]|nr:helix-turn-helix transcriptional regulator [Phycisphaerae bacterium]